MSVRAAGVADEHGETLVELLVTILVVSIGLVTIVGAMSTSVIASDAHHGQSQAEIVTRYFSQQIVKTGAGLSSFTPCPTAAQLDPTPGTDAIPATVAGSGWHAGISSTVEYWIPDVFPNGRWVTLRDEPPGPHYNPLDPDTCMGSYRLCNPNYSLFDLPSCEPGLVQVAVTVTQDRSDSASVSGSKAVTSRVVVRRNNAA